MSYQASSETGSKSPHIPANNLDVDNMWTSKTNNATSSSDGESDNHTTSSDFLPSTRHKPLTPPSPEQSHHLSPPTLTLSTFQEDAISWDGTTLDGRSHSDSESTLHDDEPTPSHSPSPNLTIEPLTNSSDADLLDAASIPLPTSPSDPSSLEDPDPDPTSFTGPGLISTLPRCHASAPHVRRIGRSPKKRLALVEFAEAKKEAAERGEEVEKEVKDRADRIVGEREWRPQEDVEVFGTLRPVGAGRCGVCKGCGGGKGQRVNLGLEPGCWKRGLAG